MKTIIVAAVFAAFAFGGAQAQPAPGPNGKCLWTYQIDHTVVTPDTRAIIFHMKDGTTWRNTLHAACPGLKTRGFVFAANGDEVCGGQGIRVLQLDQVCSLGAFTPETQPATHS